ncbi:type II toxin-antitoxin system PemK/MazF family toxin [Arcicella sp. LKC2W]|uniref:type II toxin-antitoxin system PemK/MazF family toxin n=1 Tax=Arcicella sp. LKC2W TaxID=2984198 RepID=UPI002B2200D6|nr:type II toxin-antitoxin system PemK/MazF family toxin [Arcicella sp. LKC2W]MEA5459698.1 type II toxin-antitoxin system PemK/MazF family toxin [Arcicella sp. LKC2W]
MKGKVSPLEIIEANFYFPNDGSFKPHPVLVVSTSELFDEEEIFYGVLMTTKNIIPKYTIKIESAWLTKSPNKDGYFATHFVQIFTMDDVTKKNNTFLKPEYFDRVKSKIIKSVFHEI